MMHRLAGFLVIFQMSVATAIGQGQPVDSLNFERAIENLLPQQEYDFNYNDLYDKLFTLYSDPIDLNIAERQDFQSLFFLTESEIDAIINHRAKYGNFVSVYELQGVEGLEQETIQRLLPFIKITGPGQESLLRKLQTPDVHELVVRYQTDLETKKGYTSADTTSQGDPAVRYLGNPGRIFSRYTFSRSSAYSLGFTVERDPGEQIIWDPATKRYGMDYYSFHLSVQNIGFIKKIMVGDYSLDHGQGLVFGSGLRLGKGFEPITTVRRNGMGLRPYRSVYESKDFSGLAVECGLKNVNVTFFYSSVNRDAVLKPGITDSDDPAISYIQEMGLHRTPAEINAKHTLSDNSLGGNIRYTGFSGRLEVGANALLTQYNFPFGIGKNLYQRFNFSGTQNSMGSVYANYYVKDGHLFGEIATSTGGAAAINAGLLKSLAPNLQIALHYRNYSRDFHSFYGNAFGVNSTIGNEHGIYWGLKLTPHRNWLFTAYFDYYTFPWLRYRVDAPSAGYDFMTAAQWRPTTITSLAVQYRQRFSQESQTNDGSPTAMLADKMRRQLVLTLDHQVAAGLTLRTKVQMTDVEELNANHRGFLLAQDVVYSAKKFSMALRYSLFDADDYDSRIFIYEREVLHGYYMPSFYGRGTRYYFVGRYDVSYRLSLWMKLARTRYFDREKVGSGLEEIDGPHRTSISFQVRYRF